jgi:predicted transcriptional regulator
MRLASTFKFRVSQTVLRRALRICKLQSTDRSKLGRDAIKEFIERKERERARMDGGSQ